MLGPGEIHGSQRSPDKGKHDVRAANENAMKLLAGWRWVRRFAGVALALLAGMLLAPSAARGQCGHYVLFGSKTSNNGIPNASQDAPEAVPLTVPAHPSVPPGNHTPCSGPMCSRGSDSLPLAPISPSHVTGNQWGCLTTLATAIESEPATLFWDEKRADPRRHLSIIYHPPRSPRSPFLS